jgi:hypothetical protein
MSANNSGNCLAVYTDSSYYYGILSSLDENGSFTTDGNNSPGNGIVCFNPVSGGALPSESLSLLGIYSNLQPGNNVPNTSQMVSYFQGSSSSTVGPAYIKSVNGAATIIW